METITLSNLTTIAAYTGTILCGSAAILMWIYRELNNLRSGQSILAIEMAQKYVSTEDMRHLEQRLESAIIRIEDRLDRLIAIANKNATEPKE